MARLHLRFRDFHLDTLAATEALFDQKPWRFETDEERVAVAQVWCDALTTTYNIPPVRVAIGEQIESDPQEIIDSLGDFDDEFGDEDDPLAFMNPENDDPPAAEETTPAEPDERPILRLSHWSFVVLFKRFREYMVRSGYEAHNRYPEDDVIGWAYSLFYTVRPKMFRARVREGRIPRVYPDDLLTTETLRERTEEEERRAEAARVAQARAEMESDDTEPEAEDFEDMESDEVEDYDIGEEPETQTVESETIRAELPDALEVEMYPRTLSRDALRRLAAEQNIPGRGKMSKEELLVALRASVTV